MRFIFLLIVFKIIFIFLKVVESVTYPVIAGHCWSGHRNQVALVAEYGLMF
jgi:hypothetical protein